MSAFKDIYDILKDLKDEAKRLKSQEMFSLAMDVQEKLFEFKEEIENVRDENKTLKAEIEEMKNPKIKEEDISYTQNGFFTLNNEDNKIPYCSACWKLNGKTVPLAKGTKAWWHYSCPLCKSDFSILDTDGNPIF